MIALLSLGRSSVSELSWELYGGEPECAKIAYCEFDSVCRHVEQVQFLHSKRWADEKGSVWSEYVSVALINAPLHWQVAVALSRRTTKNPRDSQSVKSSRCLQEGSVINNITNARRGVGLSCVMNFKSEKWVPARSRLIIRLSSLRLSAGVINNFVVSWSATAAATHRN